MDNIIKRYKRRPSVLEQLCYAEFASWNNLCKEPKGQKCDEMSGEQELPETEYEYDKDEEITDIIENKHDDRQMYFPCGTQIKRRLRQKVIYSHFTPMNQDRMEFYGWSTAMVKLGALTFNAIHNDSAEILQSYKIGL